MIIDALIGIVIIILNLFGLVFGAISYAIPDDVQTSFEWAFAKLGVFQNIFPMDTVTQVLAMILAVWLLLYGLRIFKWLWAHVPWFGSHEKFPGSESAAIAQHRHFEKVMKGKGVHSR
jgi:hypothetical protein